MKLSRAIAYLRRLAGLRHPEPKKHFTRIYEENIFGGEESRSGTGSTLQQTERLRRELPGLLTELQVRTFLDAPCGDCHWMAKLDWTGTSYTGVDVVPALIEANSARLASTNMRFVQADLCRDTLPKVDLILCRDCWVHLDYGQIMACLANFRRSGSEYLLTTTFTDHVKNDDLGGVIWRPINLQLPPFSFPPPEKLIVEGCTEEEGRFADKSLGLWRIRELNI